MKAAKSGYKKHRGRNGPDRQMDEFLLFSLSVLGTISMDGGKAEQADYFCNIACIDAFHLISSHCGFWWYIKYML
jgi:hypothetical protein